MGEVSGLALAMQAAASRFLCGRCGFCGTVSPRRHGHFTGASPRRSNIRITDAAENLMRDLPLPTFPISDLYAPPALRRPIHRAPADSRGAGRDPAGFDVVWARHEDEVREASA